MHAKFHSYLKFVTDVDFLPLTSPDKSIQIDHQGLYEMWEKKYVKMILKTFADLMAIMNPSFEFIF